MRAEARERLVEGQGHDGLGPVPGEERVALFRRGQQKRRIVGAEIAARMRIENDGAGARAQPPGERGHAREKMLMAEMNAVEIADGGDDARLFPFIHHCSASISAIARAPARVSRSATAAASAPPS